MYTIYEQSFTIAVVWDFFREKRNLKGPHKKSYFLCGKYQDLMLSNLNHL